MQNEAVEKDQGGKEGAHAIEGGDLAVVLEEDGVAVGRHPAAAASDGILRVVTVGGEVPIDEKVEGKPAQERKSALAQARWDSYGSSQGAHPKKEMEDVLYHDCDRADAVPMTEKGGFSCDWRLNPGPLKAIICMGAEFSLCHRSGGIHSHGYT